LARTALKPALARTALKNQLCLFSGNPRAESFFREIEVCFAILAEGYSFTFFICFSSILPFSVFVLKNRLPLV